MYRRPARLTWLFVAAVTVPATMFVGARAAGPTFAAPVRASGGGSEPGIDIGGDGAVFVNAPSGLGVHSKLWRSLDGGASFQPTVFSTGYNRLPGGGDSDVVVAPGGRIYFLDLWAGSNSLTVSLDNGTTWTSGTPFTTLPLTDRQWIAVGARNPVTDKDTVYIASVDPAAEPAHACAIERRRTHVGYARCSVWPDRFGAWSDRRRRQLRCDQLRIPQSALGSAFHGRRHYVGERPGRHLRQRVRRNLRGRGPRA